MKTVGVEELREIDRGRFRVARASKEVGQGGQKWGDHPE